MTELGKVLQDPEKARTMKVTHYLIFLLDIRIRSPKHRRYEPPEGCAVHTSRNIIMMILVIKRRIENCSLDLVKKI